MEADRPETGTLGSKQETKPFRILIVDDEEFILAFIGIKLRTSGYEVIAAHDGVQALKLIKKSCPDLVVMDLIMPRMDGIQLLEEIRRFSDVPVIVLSAIEPHEFIVHEVKKRSEGYIQKPFNPDDLVRCIEAIRKRRQDSR